MSNIPNYTQIWSGQVPGGYNDPDKIVKAETKGEINPPDTGGYVPQSRTVTRTEKPQGKDVDPPSLLKPLVYAAAAVLTIGLLT